MPSIKHLRSKQIIELFGNEFDFVHGRVERIQTLGQYTVVEYVKRGGSTAFRAYVEKTPVEIEFPTLEAAMVAAVAFNYGEDIKSALYFLRMIGAPTRFPWPVAKD